MLTRVIFLDYDGVLNDFRYLAKLHSTPGVHSGADSLDIGRLIYLHQICYRTGAQVVLTSSWRNDIEARQKLKRFGIKIAGSVPHKYDNRGEEIRQWLVDKKYNGEWIIIDDECSDLTPAQRDRLILTRENTNGTPVLGLRPKHVRWAESMFAKDLPRTADEEFLTAILSAIENDLLRVMWNINQEEYDKSNPFQNTGNVSGFTNNTFEVHAYDWNWDFSDSNATQPLNFRWQDFQVRWYKRMGRSMSTNRSITHDELALMLHECLQSLREYEHERDDFCEEVL